ncbi:toll/interleukin-1 receptor domain-containing protein [Streptomyces antibioticus]|uniref:toll/interleukin-1 receptor domain-containing protein n=1 Tax=Streptomyces antibioticus TaxID=1890 RepID=UPI0022550CF9|nr:toll/interleukin-1 receptor domain-containing protein [Streptomyces antibioticus]MCX4738118.1 tetratricopeptide repeat protein [Streptomyces antibioticus]
MSRPVVFISHTHTDQSVADAVRDAVFDLFGRESVTVTYSTSRELGGGVPIGEDWFRWIGDQVRAATVTLVLLTPTSVQKPWVLWEAGAVYGAALTSENSALRRVRPLAFQIGMDDIPSPLRSSHAQVARGDQYEDIALLLNEFVSEFSIDDMGRAGIIRAAQNVPAAAKKLLDASSEALRLSPLAPTEQIVNEWCARLDNLAENHRHSEVRQLHEWLLVAFGQDEEKGTKPIDIRIHRRLAQLYMAAAHYEEAAEQFELARRISPRDIFVMRSLGQAYLAQPSYADAARVISEIEKLDPHAFTKNAECAALKGRWYREQGQHTEAHEVYANAFQENPESYYLGNLLATAKLQLGDKNGAAEIYRRTINIIEQLPDRNFWVYATAANAAIVSGDDTSAVRYFAEIRKENPSEAEIESIEGGLNRLQPLIGITEEEMEKWKELLHRDTPMKSEAAE